jgi:hypothetical protein
MTALAFADERVIAAEVITETAFEDASPFGLQGLKRNSLQILKPEFIGALAATLALRSRSRREIRDPQFVAKILSWYPSWQEEFQVVRLIERSLWINGQNDLVMTLTPNPSQIPDNPPPEINGALTRAYVLHPQATVWYGVPVFSDQKNSQGLPIPLTAAQIQAERDRRIAAAQAHALRWRWLYRAMVSIPAGCRRFEQAVTGAVRRVGNGIAEYGRRARRDARRRVRAEDAAQMEYVRHGRTWTEIPEHTTLLGRLASEGLKVAVLAKDHLAAPAAASAGVSAAVTIGTWLPTLFVPIPLIMVDPFLFVELPDETGKLRHLGHWFWQPDERGGHQLHLHS